MVLQLEGGRLRWKKQRLKKRKGKRKGWKRRDEKYAARNFFRLLQFIVKQTDDSQRQRPERGGEGVPQRVGQWVSAKSGEQLASWQKFIENKLTNVEIMFKTI